MDLGNFKNKTENLNSPQEVVSVKQYFAIIGVLMVVIILGINFVRSLQLGSGDKKEEVAELTESPTIGPKREVAGEKTGPVAKKATITPKKISSTPTKAPTATPTKPPVSTPTPTSSPTNTPAPTSTPPPITPTETPTPTPTEALIPTPE